MGRVKTVVIIGAGLSGLRAADILLKSRLVNVIILEGRDRIGGRTHTSSAHSWKTPLDYGCAWIHGTQGNPLWPIAKAYDVQTYEIAASAIREANEWLNEEATEFIMTYVFKLGEEAVEWSKAHQAEIDPKLSLKDFCRDRIAMDASLSSDQRRRLLKMIHFYTNLSADEIELQSLRNYLLEEELPGDSPILATTYAPIIKHVAGAAIDADIIQLNQKVIKISTSSACVTLSVRNSISQKMRDVCADVVICTIPLGVLQSSNDLFAPPLPNDVQFAISELAMGSAEKLYIKMNSAFWTKGKYPGKADIFAFLPEEGGELVELISLADFPTNREPLLLCYSAANVARLIADLWQKGGKEAVKTWVMQFIRKLPGYEDSTDCQINDLFSTNWTHDEFSMGSYSYSPVGSLDTKSACDRISQGCPDSNLFFAGEHAASIQAGYEIGTSHGAYGSGEHTAKLVMAHLGMS